ncbi:DUF3604 domain-containing protein [Parahaliea maris]|nr:DUF3604 domain-containing protein [Parahaliea maris]
MIKSTLKVLLWLILLLILTATGLYLWLRWEFARLERNDANYQALFNAPVAALPAQPVQPCRDHYPQRRAWFGALHVHTAASYDATAFGVIAGADEAYRFARGEPLPLRLQGDGAEIQPPVARISSPLDFMAVTDHAEGLGENRLCYDRSSDAYGRLVCRLYRGDLRLPLEETAQPMVRLASTAIFGQDRSARVCGEDAQDCLRAADLGWRDNQRATEQWQDHSDDCNFTTFHAYEYSLAEEASNLHRNVIFRSATVPQSIAGAKEARTPPMLWQWLATTCREGHPDCDVLAIPHNSNWSSGRMWLPYRYSNLSAAEARAEAELRASLEPLAEIMQTKGDSECRNGLASVLGAPDEACDFEKLRPATAPVQDCGNTPGSGGMMLKGCVSRFNYLRHVLAEGQADAAVLGVNPFKLGIIADTDTHTATPNAGQEANWQGSHGHDRDVQHRLLSAVEVPGDIATGSPVRYNPGGVAGIYAEQNSRAALFDAMRRRETFGTSGPRIRPRFFAGWELPEDLCDNPDFLATAYARGVPMGGDLPPAHGTAASPLFALSAAADPRPEGGLLQRLQIIKTWVDAEGRSHQAVFDVAGEADNGAGVDPDTCEVFGPGSSQLCATWRDPGFAPAQSAVYYARVLQNPSCRWSRYDCIALPVTERPPSCSDPALPVTQQERAWTSPIWYRGR